MGCGNSTEKTNPKIIDVIDADSPINCLTTSEDQSVVIAGLENGLIHMYTARTEELEDIGIFKGHTGYISCLTTFEDYIISGSSDSTIRRWDMKTCECVQVYIGHTSRISKLITNGEIIISTSYDKTVRLWSYSDDEEEEDETLLRVFKGHTAGVFSIIYIPGPKEKEEALYSKTDRIITGSVDCTARIWFLEYEKEYKVLKGHAGGVAHMAVDDIGKHLFTASSDCTIRSWNIDTGECLKEMVGHKDRVMHLIVQSRLLYSASSDGTVKCWVHEFGDLARTYKGHRHSVTVIKVHHGLLFTGSGDTCIRVFDVKTGYLKRIFKEHTAAITGFIIVGDKLISTSLDKTVRSWDIKNVKEDPNVDPEIEDNE